ncbi:lamin tail domain-containing protein 2 isoform X4 [Marmota marmota marmota]|uniref:lamin tail domain-containing protein 2 isoform X4 n=1 Tax=Marmota marmota marmota TaxID=9994 RepID=UPI0020923AD2|nr:lamin tail domain-containing protein 2 isoform X4 [Marmota marmota marmota]
MAPESGQQSEEKQEPRTPADGEPVSGDLGLPTGTPTDTVVPPGPQSTKTHSTRLASVHLQLAPEALDPRTLRLLWGQRELEIQALRWAIRNGPHARQCHILQEVSGLPSERSFHSPDKFLQEQVEKLTQELKAQKEQAQLEKEHLEEQLMQTVSMLQQLEAQLQAFQKSCLLQLACSSWVGRVLRSQTGSVEVVTAETLRDSSDFSENEAPTAGEGFRLEDMDWNSIALRYPNLFSDSSTKQKQPQQSPSLEKGGWDSSEHMEKHPKTLEWSSLPCMATSSSGGAGSDFSSCQPVVRSGVQKASGYPAQTEELASSERIPTMAWSFGGHSEGLLSLDLLKTHSQPLSKTPEDPCTAPDHRRVSHQLSPTGCCLKIVAVSRREKFVRILNESLEQTVALDGFLLQQLERGFPVCLYRFPPGTLLAPQHHITVWGQGTSSTKKQAPLSLGQDAGLCHPSLGCLTLLLNPEGQVLGEHQTPHRVTSGSRIFTDNTDWSIDRFPLSKARPCTDTSGPRSRPRPPGKSRVRETGARRRRRPGWAPRVPPSCPSKTHRDPLQETPHPTFCLLGLASARTTSWASTLHYQHLPRQPPPRSYQGPCTPLQAPVPPQVWNPFNEPLPARLWPHTPLPPRMRDILPLLSTCRPFHLPEDNQSKTLELLPPIIPEAGLCTQDCPTRKEFKVRVCRKNVDRSCPMVTLSVQSTAESRYGFRFLSCPPITVDTCQRV